MPFRQAASVSNNLITLKINEIWPKLVKFTRLNN